MTSDFNDEEFITRFIERFQWIEKEIPKEVPVGGKERNFRFSLAQNFFGTLLGWTRFEGQGHYVVGEKYDITLYDDGKFPVIIVETKSPDDDLTKADEKQLKDYLEEVGSARYGVLTNWHYIILYEYGVQIGWKTIANINVERVIQKGISTLSSNEKSQILELNRLNIRKFVHLDDPEYFEKNYRQIPVLREREEGIKSLTENLGVIIINLSDVMKRFFEAYKKRTNHHSRGFLDKAFKDWLSVSGKEKDWDEEKQQAVLLSDFCRETAYVIIGRSLFTRICEDKEISKKPLISGKNASVNIQSQLFLGRNGYEYLHILESVYEHIEEYYEHFYKLGIFDWWKLSQNDKALLTDEEKRKQVDLEKELNDIVRDMLRVLNRFDFGSVDKDILKDVYQRYLPKDERKRLGEFYTPDEIITYILDSVGYTADNEIETKFLLDPACGSGSFLVEALRRLIQRYEKRGFNLDDPIIAKNVLDDIVDRVNGLDINPFACFIAEMNLLFQVVDVYEVVKKKYSDYKLKRFNIFQTDSLAPSLTDEQRKTMELELVKTTNSRAKVFVEESAMADEIKEKEFDFIVGNPPYVRKERITNDYKSRVLEKTYPEVYHGDNDIYVYFLSKGINWLRNEGNFSYIVSGKFMQTRYGRNIRTFISTHSIITQLLYFGDAGIFKDVANYPCIITLKKTNRYEDINENILKTIVVKPTTLNPSELMSEISNKLELEIFADDNISIFPIEQKRLGKDEWKIVPIKSSNVFEKIKKKSDNLLKDVCDVYYGIKTGNNSVFVIDEKAVAELGLEKTLLKPVLEGEDIRKYNIINRKKFLIFPYKKEDRTYKVVDIEKYPNINRYLCQYQNELANRYDIKLSKSNWFELRTCQYYDIFESTKIITPKMALKNSFTLDVGTFCLDSCFEVVLKKNEKNDELLKYILGLLNSKVLEFYFKQIGTFVRDRWYIYHMQYLVRLPIVEMKDEKITNQLITYVNQIIRFNLEINFLQEKIENFPISYLYSKGEKLLIVAKSFPTKFSKGVYQFSDNDLQIETVREITGEDSYRLRIAKNEYIVFRAFNEARYAQKLFRKREKVTKTELISLVFPFKEDLDGIMIQCDQDVQKIQEDKETIKKLEEQIDEIVYDLYELDLDDKRIIEEYLATS